MSGYGSYTATCGRCGNSFTGTGVVGDMRAMRWLRDHEKNECRMRTEAEKTATFRDFQRQNVYEAVGRKMLTKAEAQEVLARLDAEEYA